MQADAAVSSETTRVYDTADYSGIPNNKSVKMWLWVVICSEYV